MNNFSLKSCCPFNINDNSPSWDDFAIYFLALSMTTEKHVENKPRQQKQPTIKPITIVIHNVSYSLKTTDPLSVE
jgi:hypothetical protein